MTAQGNNLTAATPWLEANKGETTPKGSDRIVEDTVKKYSHASPQISLKLAEDLKNIQKLIITRKVK
jgi:hypothetical protein